MGIFHTHKKEKINMGKLALIALILFWIMILSPVIAALLTNIGVFLNTTNMFCIIRVACFLLAGVLLLIKQILG